MYNRKVMIGQGGRVVIPANLRERLNMRVGDELNIRVEDNELRLSSLRSSIAKAQAVVQRCVKHKNLVEKLQEMRREEVADE
jgi:AbrB family looped-hinge helix DNA binding protein